MRDDEIANMRGIWWMTDPSHCIDYNGMKHKQDKNSYVLFLLAVLLILGLTLQNSDRSAELSQSVQKLLQKALPSIAEDGNRVRKYAHTAEYFLLGTASAFLFRKDKHGPLKALLLCAAVSLSDQTLKILVPGREFDWTDFPFDAAGIGAGIGIEWIIDDVKRRMK